MSDVSIHAFRGEGDRPRLPRLYLIPRFNPRLPGGRRPVNIYIRKQAMGFNPRLPGGRRPSHRARSPVSPQFQSTPSGGKATFVVVLWYTINIVSIHAFRGEGDDASTECHRYMHRFNPRLPGGRRLLFFLYAVVTLLFQSTPSGGKATAISRAAVPCSRQIL